MKSSYAVLMLVSFCFSLLLAAIYFLHLNQSLFFLLNRLSQTTGSFVWANLTFLGDALVTSVSLLFFIRRKPDLVWSGIFALLITDLLVHGIKWSLNIPRPAAVIDSHSLILIGPVLRRFAFPSGHTATIFALIGVLLIYFRKACLTAGLLMIASLVGISRVVVGAHWPLDVAAGAIIGSLSAIGGHLIGQHQVKERALENLILGAVGLGAAIALLFVYDSGFSQARSLQTVLAIVILIFGSWQYVGLIRSLRGQNKISS